MNTTTQARPVLTGGNGGTCKAVCWILSAASGGYMAYVLVADFALDPVQAAIIGIVFMLLSGFVLRAAFCRRKGSRVQNRVAEAAARKVASGGETKKAGPQPQPNSKAVASAAAKAREAVKALDDDTGAKPGHKTERPGPIAKEIVPPARDAGRPLTERPDKKFPDANDDELSEKIDTLGLKAADMIAAPGDTTTTPGPDDTPADGARDVEIPATPAAGDDAMTPKALERPRNGTPDDLQKIDGLGADAETALNRAGVFHFDQIAAMNRKELVWLDQNLPGAAGLATQNNWKRLAKLLGENGDG